LACTRSIDSVLAPASVYTPTVTPIPNSPTFTATPTATLASSNSPTITATPNQTLIPYNCGAYNLVMVPTPGGNVSSLPTAPLPGGGFPISEATYVIRTLANWQTYCGSTTITPPVDFNTQMLIINSQIVPFGWCGGNVAFTGVCQGPSQVTIGVNLTDGMAGTGYGESPPPIPITPGITPIPTPIPYRIEAIAVANSNLPVVLEVVQYTVVPCPI
jgi:hypothetical protein